MPAWVLWILRLVRKPEVIEEIAPAVVKAVDEAIHGAEPAQPLTWRDVEHIRAQEKSATSRGVVEGPPRPRPPPRPPVKARDRETARPPRKPPRP